MSKAKAPNEQVLQASLVILNKFGYGALCLTEVAKHLKVTKQRIYYHYPGSEEILLQLAKKWSESGQLHTLEALACTKENGSYRVKAMAEGMFNWMEADSDLARLGLVLYQLSPHIKRLGTFMDVAREAGRARMKSLLLLDPQFQKLKAKDLDGIVTVLHSHMYGFFFYAVAMGDFTHLEEIRQNCLNGLQELLLSYSKV